MNDERSTINDRDRLTSHYIPPVRILLIVDRSSFFYLFHVTFSFLLRLAYVNGTKTLDSVQAASPVATPERLLEEKDEFSLMRHIISTLPPLQQTILRMKDVEEYETEEIAEITGCSSEAIRSNLSRARKKVRDIYLQTIQQRKRRNEA